MKDERKQWKDKYMEETLKISFSDLKNRDVQRNDLKTKEEDPKEVDYEDAIKLRF